MCGCCGRKLRGLWAGRELQPALWEWGRHSCLMKRLLAPFLRYGATSGVPSWPAGAQGPQAVARPQGDRESNKAPGEPEVDGEGRRGDRETEEKGRRQRGEDAGPSLHRETDAPARWTWRGWRWRRMNRKRPGHRERDPERGRGADGKSKGVE